MNDTKIIQKWVCRCDYYGCGGGHFYDYNREYYWENKKGWKTQIVHGFNAFDFNEGDILTITATLETKEGKSGE